MSAVAKKKPELVRIKFTERESGWAEKLPGGKYRLQNIPVFDTIGLCIDDVVTVKPYEGWLLVDKVVESVFAGKKVLFYKEEWQFGELCGAAKYLGCKVEGLGGPAEGKPGMMVVVYPKGVSPLEIAKKLGISQKRT